MEEYPRSLAEFEAWFDTEQGCRDYVFRVRRPEGFQCPRCDGRHFWPVRSVLMQCQACGHQTSVTAGTIFLDTRKPLVDWFRAMYWLASHKNGASALGLQRVLGLGSYKTAWTWLHKFRRAMVRTGRDRLTGRVEVDETYLGGLEEGVRGRQTERKSFRHLRLPQALRTGLKQSACKCAPSPARTSPARGRAAVTLDSQAVNGCDIGMIQRGQRVRLALEPRHALGVGGERRQEHLDSDVAAKTRVARAVDFAHAACAEAGSDLVRADRRAGQEYERSTWLCGGGDWYNRAHRRVL